MICWVYYALAHESDNNFYEHIFIYLFCGIEKGRNGLKYLDD